MQEKISACRICQSPGVVPVLSLGVTPLADGLLKEDQISAPEPRFPLSVAFCPECSLVQLQETVSPDQLFCQDYPYYSSFSPALLKHSRENALNLIRLRNLNSGSFVIELASNDGYLLKNFVEHGIPVLGIDPAEGPARAAEAIGVPTQCTFFSSQLAQDLRSEGKAADVIVANNVLAHVADTHGFVDGIHTLLKDTGVAVIEAPYLKDLVQHCEFDTIYHEHLCYFSVTALDRLFRMHGLFLNDVERLSIHGGSLRLYVEKIENVSPRVTTLLREEREEGLTHVRYYQDFASRVERIRTELRMLLNDLKQKGARIAAYGAAAKGSTLINYCDLGTDLIDFVVDRNTHKHGRYMPGQHIPILATEALLDKKPDYVLLLAWNFADEILEQQKAYRQLGGRFITPVPQPRVM
ncbi:MAG: class I SAM-dependent methyltransferase [Bryobacterales bacterium]|nr:class I SAM-dependent methyltransferase [Bryobacterales bacterium]